MAHRRFVSAVGSGLLVLLLWGTAHAAGPYAYLTHYWLNQVSVVDSSGALVATVDVGTQPMGVAATPARVYVTNSGSANVTVIDTATNTPVATIPVGPGPLGIAADPSGQTVWVGNQGNSTLTVIDTATNTPIGTVILAASPVGLAFHPAGTAVLVSMNDGTLAMFSATDHTILDSMYVGANARGVAVSAVGPDVIRAWVAFHEGVGGQVAVVDVGAETLDLVTTVLVSNFPTGVAVDPQGSRVYVGDSTRSVTVFDAQSSGKLGTVTGLGWGLAGLTVHPTAPELWVADEADIRVFIIDTETLLPRWITVADTTTSFGTFIPAPAAAPAPPDPPAPGCDDGLQAAVEQGLAKVEETMRRWFQPDFAVPGDTSAARVVRLGKGVKDLNRGHLMGVYHSLLGVPDSAGPADPQICDESLKTAVQQALTTTEYALQGIDKTFTLPGNGMVARLQHLAGALAGLDRGRLDGLYRTLR